MATKMKPIIISAFKMNGLSLRSDASKLLADVLTPLNEDERSEWLDKIIDCIQKQQLNTAMIGRSEVEAAIEECNEDTEEESDKVLSVIDAFSIPMFSYNSERKKLLLNKYVPSLHGSAKDKANLFSERYTILHQRTSRHNLFTPPVLGSLPEEKSHKFQLKPVEYLLGSSSKLGEIIVLGMITQIKEGKYHLEDPTGAVELDLSKAQFHNGLFTENCFVLAEGWYEDEVFHINAFGFPPAEPSDITRSFFGNTNFFGGPSATSVKVSKRLKTIEQDNDNAMFVFISEVWLDQLKVRQKLQTLFSGLSDMPPTCFVFCGNFTSTPYGSNHVKILTDSLQMLMSMLQEFPSLIEGSKFVFVPGPRDPGPGNILPRKAIPDCITEEFRRNVPGAIFTSNPCRIQYCTQEMVIFREDILTKMCRNCVRFPEAGSDIPSHFVKTVISQSHLSPLPLHVSPIYWSYDSALRLYPLPDLVMFGDKCDPFTITNTNCLCINAGSFSNGGYCFKVYYPKTREVEDSKIED
ncbi:DNA polymerase epsilon subunit 2-like [Anneissia japonica]|uniref:DNA polymerase epsilon subunit 2-like n=1 Tax=Anneissia japonica TaxID=1529436 RepID=UPI0014256D27|nr:DNA polymerase epsilon subunit 2-like [Anneissia japonica]